MIKMIARAAAVFAAIGAAGAAQAEGDAANGEKVFRRCAACHVVDKEQNRVGPYLKGVYGREVGGVDSYKYSDAMLEWGEGKVWNDETLAEYLEAPMQVVKGTKMAYPGLKKDDELADVIAYLKANSQ